MLVATPATLASVLLGALDFGQDAYEAANGCSDDTGSDNDASRRSGHAGRRFPAGWKCVDKDENEQAYGYRKEGKPAETLALFHSMTIVGQKRLTSDCRHRP